RRRAGDRGDRARPGGRGRGRARGGASHRVAGAGVLRAHRRGRRGRGSDGVRGFWPIYKRELFALFVTPLAWVLITTFLIVQGIHFFLLVTQFAGQADLGEGGPVQAFFGKTILLYLPLLFICPLLTMRLFAEERRSGTIEALLTAPVGSTGVTLAKYCAALVTYMVLWAPTLLYIVLISKTGAVDWRVVGASYLGLFGIGAGYLAIGTMTSALTQSQLTAAVLSAMA